MDEGGTMAESEHPLYVVRAALADCTAATDDLFAAITSAEKVARQQVKTPGPWAPSQGHAA